MRQEPQFLLNEQTNRDGQKASGMFITRPDAGVDVYKPSWDGTTTVFRPFPSLRVNSTTEVYPYRVDPTGSNKFGNWIRKYPCAWGVGTSGQTFLLGDGLSASYDKWRTPLAVLYNAIDKAIKASRGHPEWFPLTQGGAGRGKALKLPSALYVLQGMLLVHKSKPTAVGGKHPPGYGSSNTCLLVLSESTGDRLIEKLGVQREGFHGDPADFEGRYVEGDPVSLDSGRYITLFEAGHDPRQQYQARPVGPVPGNPMGGPPGSVMGGQGGGAKLDIKGYDLYLEPTFQGYPAAFTDPDVRKSVLSKWKFWEDIMHVPSEIEQAHILSRSFPASAILYAFADHPDWIPDDIKHKVANPTSTTAGWGQPAAPGYPQPSQGYPPANPGYQMPPQGYPAAAPYGTPPASPYGATPSSPYGAPPVATLPSSPYGAPPVATLPSSPYGAPPVATPPASPYGAPPTVAAPSAGDAPNPWARPAIDQSVPVNPTFPPFSPPAATTAPVDQRTLEAIARLQKGQQATPPPAES